MILRYSSLILFALVFAPSLLHAQRLLSFSEKEIVATNDQPGYDKMYEDIEILRRILDRKLQPLYQRVQHTRTNPMYAQLFSVTPSNISLPSRISLPSNIPPNTVYNNSLLLPQPPQVYPTIDLVVPDPFYNVQLPNSLATWTTEEKGFSSLEGVYLKGQGIVYTATLTSLQPTAKTEAAKKPVSEWESVRREVRNEKDKPKKPDASKPPSLSDVLLKVLAENGHNFSQLGENESLTIIITVHDASPSSTATKAETGSAKTESKPSKNGGGSDLQSQVRDLELLGELHLKQGKYNEAIEALHNAMKMTKSPKRNAELCRKLAQCYLMRQDPADFRNARATLEEAIALMEKEPAAKEKPAPAPKPPSALPVKLIISAPKKLLDQAKEGKITFDEFRRQAHEETLSFDDRR